MSYRLKILRKKPPAGWDLLEDHFEESERKMKEAVEEPHEGKRKAECTWMIHKLHWERNRFSQPKWVPQLTECLGGLLQVYFPKVLPRESYR